MIVEQRVYTFHPGKLQAFLEIYEGEGRAVQMEYLPHLLGYYVAEIGLLNRITALWGYPSMQARTEMRAALFADPRWIEYLKKVRPLMATQESVLLQPAPFYRETLARLMAEKETRQ